jgi:L-histidine Nalpha-methyltransferase
MMNLQLRTDHAEHQATLLREETLRGLRSRIKTLPPKFFYDRRGSELFTKICEQPEYYLTRTEIAILRDHAAQIAEQAGPKRVVIEPGAGDLTKIRILLSALEAPAAYVPIDISSEYLASAARSLAKSYPGLPVLPVCADFTEPFSLPRVMAQGNLVFFPGSTIGNLDPDEAVGLLHRLGQLAGNRGGILVGVDLMKDPSILNAAYNDRAGVTAKFNLNILARLNADLDASFELESFRHYAFYNPGKHRVEMHLVSTRDQIVRVAGEAIRFRDGESIHTENSYKYTPEGFGELAEKAGLSRRRVWLDAEGWFSVQYLSGLRNEAPPYHTEKQT